MTMATRMRARGLVLGLALAAGLTGCGLEAKRSGFLDDYSQLQPNPKYEGTMLYLNPQKPLKDYNSFIVEPVVVHFAPDSKGGGIDPETLNELAVYFHDQAVKGLTESGYKVVKDAGPGVLRVRTAITQIDKTVPVANIHPAMKMTGLGLGGASMEAEGTDSQSKDRVFAVTDSRKGSRLDITGGLQWYGNAKSVMEEWAKRFVARVDEAHGKPPR
jgi:hypothetical protein